MAENATIAMRLTQIAVLAARLRGLRRGLAFEIERERAFSPD
jgi:hypothetical protein